MAGVEDRWYVQRKLPDGTKVQRTGTVSESDGSFDGATRRQTEEEIIRPQDRRRPRRNGSRQSWHVEPTSTPTPASSASATTPSVASHAVR